VTTERRSNPSAIATTERRSNPLATAMTERRSNPFAIATTERRSNPLAIVTTERRSNPLATATTGLTAAAAVSTFQRAITWAAWAGARGLYAVLAERPSSFKGRSADVLSRGHLPLPVRLAQDSDAEWRTSF
jgi:hypothetical protein